MTTENVTATGDQQIAALVASGTLPPVVPPGSLYASLNPFQQDQVGYAYEALMLYQAGLGVVPNAPVPTPAAEAATNDATDPTVLS